MPFKYRAAPMLIRNDGRTEFPLLKSLLDQVDRKTWEAKFASKFRSRRHPVRRQVGQEIARVYRSRRRTAPARSLSKVYTDALPFPPPLRDPNRSRTYAALLARAGSRVPSCRG
jgi:hypothetical protein